MGVSSVNPPCLYWARPVWERVYFTNAIAAGVGVPMIVMLITCGEPLFMVAVPPGGKSGGLLKKPPKGTYGIDVNGQHRGALVIGSSPGP